VIVRDPSWDKKGNAGSLYINPLDAKRLKLIDGDRVKILTQTGEAVTQIEITELQREGSLALPNGLGVDYPGTTANSIRVGVAPNELTSTEDKDFFAGTPWHKHVPAKIEKITGANA
jgi:anaerobic selenocysteine-containing dehydrogenase